MESTPPPPHKKLLTPRVSHIDETLLTRKSPSLQQGVIQSGPVKDGLWPEVNKVFSIFSVIQEPLESSVRERKSSLAKSCVQARVHCRCSEKCSCVRPVVERFLNTGKHDLSILRNPLELFTLQQHATDSESTLITLPDTLWFDILGNEETAISNSPDAHGLLFFATGKALCFYTMYLTDLFQQTHFNVETSSLNKWYAFFMPLCVDVQHSGNPFISVILVAGKFKPSRAQHQNNILRSAIDAHMTLCCLTKSNGLPFAAADVICLLKRGTIGWRPRLKSSSPRFLFRTF